VYNSVVSRSLDMSYVGQPDSLRGPVGRLRLRVWIALAVAAFALLGLIAGIAVYRALGDLTSKHEALSSTIAQINSKPENRATNSAVSVRRSEQVDRHTGAGDVPELTLEKVRTDGGAVLLFLVGGSQSHVLLNESVYIEVAVKRNGAVIASYVLGSAGDEYITPTDIQVLDTPPAGTYRYTVEITTHSETDEKTLDDPMQFRVDSVRLVAMVLPRDKT